MITAKDNKGAQTSNIGKKFDASFAAGRQSKDTLDRVSKKAKWYALGVFGVLAFFWLVFGLIPSFSKPVNVYAPVMHSTVTYNTSVPAHNPNPKQIFPGNNPTRYVLQNGEQVEFKARYNEVVVITDDFPDRDNHLTSTKKVGQKEWEPYREGDPYRAAQWWRVTGLEDNAVVYISKRSQ